VHSARNRVDHFRTGIGNLPFALLQHLIHQLPTADAVVGSGNRTKIIWVQHFVDLVGDKEIILKALEKSA
jgi:hypothetical protein